MSRETIDQQAHPAVQELLKGNGPVDKGYYAALGLQFTSTSTDVQKQYKRLALQFHPDKAGNIPDATERFQSITTAYHVLSNKSAIKAYWDMYRLRCYMYQLPHDPSRPLLPFYLLHVKKRDDRGLMQERLLTIDLGEGHLQNWKKDKVHRKIPLNAISAVAVTGDCTFTISFNNGQRDYRLATEFPPQCRLYISVLQGVISGAQTRPDDEFFPPRCERKGYVEKRGKTGDWAKRWIMLGARYLLIFRNMNCEELVNAVPLDGAHCSVAITGSDGSWCISTPMRKWFFRNSKVAIANDWVNAVAKMLQQSELDWSAMTRSLAYSIDDLNEVRNSALLIDTSLEQAEGPAGPDSDDDADGQDDMDSVDAPDPKAPGSASQMTTLNRFWPLKNPFSKSASRAGEETEVTGSRTPGETAAGRAVADHLASRTGMVRHHI
mmetsp:Transcript_41107/g.68315  ORF Transcript_41107/g.68315 Transcript_41107/m.68315 type:complete len:436 (-) Transcript_41107:219-1526(-)